jgi:myo-inositol-1(or 4)-monophosphatase
MIRAVKIAGRLVTDFNHRADIKVSKKGPADFVTSAHKCCDRTLRTVLARRDYGFLSEEGGETRTNQSNRYIVDPLDGTINFLCGGSNWCISIADEENAIVVAAVVYAPLLDQLYYAEQGEGAYLETQGKLNRL